MKIGDIVETAFWFSGEEKPHEISHWKTIICVGMGETIEKENGVILGEWGFTEKYPNEDRVPPVPKNITGPNVRLVVGESKVVGIAIPVTKETGFIYDLEEKDLVRLRRITRRAAANKTPPSILNDRQCDQLIEILGPEAALKTLRDGVDGRSFN